MKKSENKTEKRMKRKIIGGEKRSGGNEKI